MFRVRRPSNTSVLRQRGFILPIAAERCNRLEDRQSILTCNLNGSFAIRGSRLPSRRGWLPCNDGLSAQRFPASTRSNCGTAPDRVDSFRFHRRPDGKHQPPAQRLHIFGCRYEIVMRRIKLLVCGILYCMYGKDFSRKVNRFFAKMAQK